MPGSHWMIVMSPENFEITRERGFDVVGLKSRHRKKAERMALGDRVLFYVTGSQVFPLTATVSSTFFEDHSPIWISSERRPDVAPWRVQIRSDVVLQWYEYLDARQIAPRMLYVKRWAPEDWPLAFQGQIHLLSSQDFALIEHEMRRTIERRSRRRERPPHRPRLPVSAEVASGRPDPGLATGGAMVAPRNDARQAPAPFDDGHDESVVVSPGPPASR
jgi:EVE domain